MGYINLIRKIFYPNPGGIGVIFRTIVMMTLPSPIFIICVAALAGSAISSPPPPERDLSYFTGTLSADSELADGRNIFLSNGTRIVLNCVYPQVRGRGSRCLADEAVGSNNLTVEYWPKYNLMMSVYANDFHKYYLDYANSIRFLSQIGSFSHRSRIISLKNNAAISMIVDVSDGFAKFIAILVLFVPNCIFLFFMRAFN